MDVNKADDERPALMDDEEAKVPSISFYSSLSYFGDDIVSFSQSMT